MTPDPADARVENAISLFSTIYLGGIPSIITNDAAFLAFINILAATEALAGFRYADTIPKAGERFETFIESYFPDVYKPHGKRLWRFRCRMLHSFSPAGFVLTHHHSENHFRTADGTGNPVLNAEDFYGALLTAAQKYFADVRADSELKAVLIARLEDDDGGPIHVGPLHLSP